MDNAEIVSTITTKKYKTRINLYCDRHSASINIYPEIVFVNGIFEAVSVEIANMLSERECWEAKAKINSIIKSIEQQLKEQSENYSKSLL